MSAVAAPARPTYTPGVVGYVFADVVAALVLAVLLALPEWSATGAPGEYATSVLIVGFYALFLSIPFATIGIPLVHLACRHVAAQWVHVLAAGGAGLLAGTVLELGESQGVGAFPLVLGASCAVGRAAVIPLVPRRRS